jgi:hypothetical protein
MGNSLFFKEFDLLGSLSFMILIALIIIIYYSTFVRNDITSDPLNIIVFRIGDKCCSFWPITHFVFYSILGIISKTENYILLWTLGILWEYLEGLFSILNNPKYLNIPYLFNKETNNSDTSNFEYKQFWVGSEKDIVFNSLGLICGYCIKEYLLK